VGHLLSRPPYTGFNLSIVNLQDVRKDLAEIRDGYKRLRTELQDHHADSAAEDDFAKQMWTFVGKAGRKIDDLVDNVNHGDTSYAEVAQYYGEDEKNMTSAEFYGIFKTFVTSYTVSILSPPSKTFTHTHRHAQRCQADNRTVAEEKLAGEKRRQAAEEAKAARSKAAEDDKPNEEDNAVLDSLLEKLRKGEHPRRGRRARPSERPPAPLPLDLTAAVVAGTSDAADLARDMLARLQSDGFAAAAAPSTPTPPPRRTTRRRREPNNALRLEMMGVEEADENDGASSTGLSDEDFVSPRPDAVSPQPDVESPKLEAASPRSEPSSPKSELHDDDEGDWDRTMIAAVT
jgi:cytokinesis protein